MRENIEIFDQNAKEYDRWYEQHHWIYQSEIVAIERLLPLRVKSLEIGVGSGRFARPFDIKLGLDPSENMVKLAKNRNIDVVLGMAEALPFENEYFDLILMVTTICFLNDLPQSLRECHRILAKGGYLIIGFIDKFGPVGRKYRIKSFAGRFFQLANFYSPDDLTILLQKARFTDFQFIQTLFQPLSKIKGIEPIKKGYGKGSFVVVRSVKR